MKKLTFDKLEDTLDRDEMRNVMAGSGGGQVYIKCCGCNNSTCQGYASDCDTGRYEICGPGPAGGNGPCAICYPNPN